MAAAGGSSGGGAVTAALAEHAASPASPRSSALSSERTRIAVLGGGAWGTALALHAARMGHEVLLWALEPEVKRAVNEEHENTVFLKVGPPGGEGMVRCMFGEHSRAGGRWTATARGKLLLPATATGCPFRVGVSTACQQALAGMPSVRCFSTTPTPHVLGTPAAHLRRGSSCPPRCAPPTTSGRWRPGARSS